VAEPKTCLGVAASDAYPVLVGTTTARTPRPIPWRAASLVLLLVVVSVWLS
jgi:hypothetical protein